MKRDNISKGKGLLVLSPIFFLFFISLISAFGFDNIVSDTSSIGTFKQGDVNIVQTCSNCSYNNITSIYYSQGNKFILKEEVSMDKSGTLYNYTQQFINETGNYVVTGHGNENLVDKTWVLTFSVGSEVSLGVYVVLLIICILIVGIGIYVKESGIGIIGAMALTFLSIYTFNNGIDVYQSWVTEGFSIILGAFGLMTGFESLKDILDF